MSAGSPRTSTASAAEGPEGAGRSRAQANLVLSSYLGGGRDEGIRALAVERQGTVAVAGWTSSGNFPARNASQPGYGGGDCRFFSYDPCGDAFVAKVDPKTSRVAYATYLGGPGSDYAKGIATDDAGNTYVTGYASQGFPVHGPSRGGAEFDAFVTKLSPEGTVVFSTLLGGPGVDGANGIALDPAGNILIAGTAMAGFPVTIPGQPQTFDGRGAFVAKLDPAGALLHATFIGGDAQVGNAIAVDGEGAAYVAGSGKEGPPPQRPTRPGQSAPSDAFAAKLDRSGAVEYTRWLGGRADDDANAVALGPSGNVYVAGSAGRGFPIRRAVQARNAGDADAFIAKLDKKGSLAYSTFLGGGNRDAAHAVTVSPEGGVYVAGEAREGFPVRGALQPEKKGHTDAFLASIAEEDGRPALRYSTRLGGTGREFAQAVATRTGDPIFLAGHTDSRSDFPALSAFQPEGSGQVETFLTAISSTSQPLPLVTDVVPASGPLRGGTRVRLEGKSLNGVRSVLFGNRRGTAVAVSEDGREVSVRTPRARAGKVAVKATAPAGDSLPTPGSHYEYAQGLWTTVQARTRYHHAATPLPDGRVLVVGGCTRLSQAGACDFGPKAPPTEIFDSRAGTWTRVDSPSGEPIVQPVAALIPERSRSTCGRNCGKVLMVSLTRRGFDAQLFDPRSAMWKRLRDPTPAQTGGHTLSPLPSGPPEVCGQSCGMILLVKHSGGSAPAFGELFDPQSETWTEITAGPAFQVRQGSVDEQLKNLASISRAYHTATVMKNGKVLLVGGIGVFGATLAPAEIYDPVENTIVPTGAPRVTRYGAHSATSMNDGKVLIAGGLTDNIGTFSFSTEIFNPEAVVDPARPDTKGAFSAGPSLVHGRYGHVAAPLKGGSVLVAGGVDSTGVPAQRGPRAEVGNALKSTEILRSDAPRWTSAGSMTEGRGAAVLLGGLATYAVPYFAVTPLPDDRLLVVGGRTAEVYSPQGTPPSFHARQETGAGTGWLALSAGLLLAGALAGFLIFRRRGASRDASAGTEGAAT